MESHLREVSVQVFGVLRNHWPTGRVSVQLPEAATGIDLKRELVRLAESSGQGERVRGILATCALGTPEGLIAEGQVIETVTGLAVLPPVCGG